jgi:hypothetical protein
VDAVIKIGLGVMWVALFFILGVLIANETPKPPKPRANDTWCHIGREMSSSGLCKNIPGLWWAV